MKHVVLHSAVLAMYLVQTAGARRARWGLPSTYQVARSAYRVDLEDTHPAAQKRAMLVQQVKWITISRAQLRALRASLGGLQLRRVIVTGFVQLEHLHRLAQHLQEIV